MCCCEIRPGGFAAGTGETVPAAFCILAKWEKVGYNGACKATQYGEKEDRPMRVVGVEDERDLNLLIQKVLKKAG